MKLRFICNLALLLLVLSCKKDFLDVHDNSYVYRQSYVNSLKTMGEFLNGIYQMNGESIEVYSISAYPEVISDNIKPVNVLQGDLVSHYAWSQKADATDRSDRPGRSTTMNGFWKVGYRVIHACSFVLEDVDKYRKDNAILADDIKGQAYALRAYIHFKLLSVFAQAYQFSLNGDHPGIPYIKTSDISKSYSRQNVNEVYEAMIADLKMAISLLPQNVPDTRQMNILAAKGLLARIYLAKGDYINAQQIASEVIAKVPLLTIGNGYPTDVFKFKPISNTETLFQSTPSASFPNFLGRVLRSPLQLYATGDIASILISNSNDIRSSWVTQSAGGWLLTKFPVGVAPEVTIPASAQSGAYYSPVIRSSELFLTVAECAYQLGDQDMAKEYLNKIRTRANPGASLITETGEELLNRIYEERRKELCFEGLRMGDLQRWKIGVHRIEAPVATAKDLPYGSDKAIAPIPPQDVELMGIPQNKGY